MDENEQQLHLVLPGLGAAEGGSVWVRGLADLAAELAECLGDDDDSAFGNECRQSSMAASFRLAVDDPSLIGAAGLGLPGALPGGSFEAGTETDLSPAAIVDGLGALIDDGLDELVPVLRSLATYGGPFQGPATAHLQATNRLAEPAPTAAVTSAYLLTAAPGDEEEVILELSYPDDPAHPVPGAVPRAGIAILVDTFAGRRPLDVLLLDDLDSYFEEFAAGPVPTGVQDVAVADAMSLLDHAFWVFDHTLEAAAGLPEDSDLLFLRPLLDRLVATHSHPEFEPVEVDDADRDDAVRAFTRWVGNEKPDIDDEALDYVPLLVDFAADQADDPRRWSATVAVHFLQMACHKVMAPPEELAALPDLVRLVVRWSHADKGWPAELTTAALDAIDHVEPLFEAELAHYRELGDGPGVPGGIGDEEGDLADLMSGLLGHLPGIIGESALTEPPVGGNHPEPFDDRRIAKALRGPVAVIVAEATDRAVELFDAEFATLTRRFIADAARRKNSPFGGGRPSIWASAAIYAVAQLNELPGGWSPLARPAAEITAALAGAPSTIAAKARALRALLDADRFPPEPRYQHSTSAGITAVALSGLLGAMSGASPAGVARERGGLRLVPSPSVEPGAVDPASVGADCFVLRAGLVGLRPEIWRRVRVPVDATFGQLHHLLQLVFGWYGHHLHAFELGPTTVGPTGGQVGFHDPDTVDEGKLRLCDTVAPGDEFVYLYDFGDNWEHQIVVEGVENLDASTDIVTGEPMGPFALLGGAMAGPPEDSGGAPGYTEILRALKNPKHPRRAELAEWVGAGYDPKRFDAYTVNQAVHRHGWDGH